MKHVLEADAEQLVDQAFTYAQTFLETVEDHREGGETTDTEVINHYTELVESKRDLELIMVHLDPDSSDDYAAIDPSRVDNVQATYHAVIDSMMEGRSYIIEEMAEAFGGVEVDPEVGEPLGYDAADNQL